MPREIVKKQLVDEQSVRELKGYVKYTLWRSVKFTPRNLFTDEPTVLDSLMKRMGYKTCSHEALQGGDALDTEQRQICNSKEVQR
jgi:hypothetical protein